MICLQEYGRNDTLIFRRWSHKANAVFLSLNKEVNIGVIAIDISSRLATKNGDLMSVTTYINRGEKTVDDFKETDISISTSVDISAAGSMTNFFWVKLFIQCISYESGINIGLPLILYPQSQLHSIYSLLCFNYLFLLLPSHTILKLIIFLSIPELECLYVTGFGTESIASYFRKP